MNSLYKEPIKTVILNKDDRDLFPIHVDILWLIQKIHEEFGCKPPKSFPKLIHIEGYGEEVREQYFKREIIPTKLISLETGIRKKYNKKKASYIKKEINIINEFWDTLDEKRDFYEEELLWIARMWHYRLFGKWFYNNGIPTWITGPNWFYLNFWYLDTELPEYRDRDRKWFIAQAFARYDDRDFIFKNKEGVAIPDRDGRYVMKHLGRRLHFGTTNTKARRVGDTSKAECMQCEIATRSLEGHVGIQGKDDDNAQLVFTHHFIKPFKKLPVFWKPLFSMLDPKTEQVFTSDNPELGLDTTVDYATTQDRSAYDGYKLLHYHRDEPGKVKREDIQVSHKVIKQCSVLGDKIIGFQLYTTTVDEMNKRGGENYLKLCNDSHYNQRDDNGQTLSGLINIFFRASESLEGYIDRYGFGVEENPTLEQAAYIKKEHGAKTYLENKRKALKAKGDMEGLSEEKRLYPQEFRECFTPPAKNVFFRVDILEATINELQFNRSIAPRKGNFVWENGKDTRVIWIDDDVNGRFLLSKHFKPQETNQWIKMEGEKYPQHPDKYVASADAFRLEKTEGGRMSKGGGVVRWKHDPLVDPPEKDIKKWDSARTIISYEYRPDTTEEYAEDMLMMCVYTGALMYPEMNVEVVAKHFKERGYGGYLLYDTNYETGEIKNNPGFTSIAKTKVKMFNLIRDDIKKHGHRQRHIDILKQCLLIQNIDEMTFYDVFTAYGGTLLAEESQLGDMIAQQQSQSYNVDWLTKRTY